ncbi:hypothetical protein A5886_002306 [Enterococcus sp. 8G7_MSG3316]|uniref:Dipeptide epimerase n=1 Tax=Candidatus Enterococcus testudinis TaxID=1834191 RepID=A0A242A8G0_9ENTE|nr:dipeptide epimerase [Enterococcus sp. 8G7_MSG3316]OTN77209.1 hypothetical protein A5886_002306 [Enterococcus sp. 8G7_MSG3316]
MIIDKIEIQKIPIKLNAPFKTALREVQVLDVIRVAITFTNGIIGIGEAAPTKVITGDTEERIISDITTRFAPFLMGQTVDTSCTLLDEMDQLVEGHSSAKAAIDIALHDALAKAANLPLYRFLGGTSQSLETDFTISIGTPEKMCHDAQEKVHSGFKSLKIKLGLGTIDEEVAKIRRINQHLQGQIPFRIDANQGWTKEEAVQILHEWQDIPIDFVEQPVNAADFAGLKYVTEHTTVPIMADESVFSYQDAKRLIEEKCCDAINIKLMKSGGIREGRKIFALAQAHHIPVMVGSMIEGYGGMAAAAHFALGMAKVRYIDLDVPFMWDTTNISATQQGVIVKPGELIVTDALGIGIGE